MVWQDLANPLVRSELEFYPHETYGKNIFASYHSFKWLGGLGRKYRVQMASVLGKHFYIYEPVQLRRHNGPIVIPIFFYKYQGTIYAKCVHPQIVNVARVGSDIKNVLTIPANIDFYSPVLEAVNISDFDLTYLELKMSDGTLFTESCGGYIVGELSNLF